MQQNHSGCIPGVQGVVVLENLYNNVIVQGQKKKNLMITSINVQSLLRNDSYIDSRNFILLC